MRVHVVDPSAYTRPYDHSLCSALARAGAQVELVTSQFAYGSAPAADGYTVSERFYRHALGAPSSTLRLASKLLEHVPDTLAYRRQAADADIVHFQWLPFQALDRHLLPRKPTVLTAHDLLPREPRPGQVRAQRRLYGAVDAVIAHSEFGRRELVEQVGVDAGKVRVVRHGAFDYLTRVPPSLPEELTPPGASPTTPVVLFFGLLRPYKGLDVLLDAWRSLDADAELWIVGRPRMDIAPLLRRAPRSTRFVPRFVTDPELAACFARANLVVLPYLATERFDFSGVLATALAFGKPAVVTDVGGFREVEQAGAARLVRPGDARSLAQALGALLFDRQARERLAEGARTAAAGSYSWTQAAERTLALYRELTGEEH
jgi:glycosyltransferase involved in cell wall biosynthesis